IVRGARRLAFDLDRYAYSTYVVELIDSMVEGQEAEAAVFELVEHTLERVDADPDPPVPEWLRAFEVKLLAFTGLEPRIDRCARCQRPSADGAETNFHFNPRTGTLHCHTCADGTGMSVSSGAIRYLAVLKSGAPPTPAPSGGEVRVILQTFIA